MNDRHLGLPGSRVSTDGSVTFTTGDRARLESQAATLEGCVVDRTRELAAAVDELEAFSYSVAHDLRAPLRAISSFSQALMEDCGDKLEATGLDYLGRICTASERMSHLIDDLLKLSKIGRRDLSWESVDLSAMIAEICQRFGERDPGRRLRVDIEPGVRAHGDTSLLSIVFENLIDNAWKFTRTKDLATIRFFTGDRNGKAIFYVQDNGVGFDTRYKHKLFSPFQRLHSATEFEGTGIGLVTVSRVIARHGGDVAIECLESGGTVVSIFLP